MTDKVVIITGGSRGIGRATALAAATRGFRVVVGYASNQAAANAVVSTIEAKNGKAIAVKCDVGSEKDILALSYDHRVIDGKEAVTFLVRVKESLEDPARLVLDL